jgi:broad specificity phosphatase PhoE
MPTILLVRHGQASFGAANYDALSATGFEQAAAVADHLSTRGLDVQRIVSGQMRRQRESAGPAAKRFQQETVIDPRWDECAMDTIVTTYTSEPQRADLRTRWHPTRVSEYGQIMEAAMMAWIAAEDSSESCESWPAFRERVNAALHELAAGLDSGATALVFTSGGVAAALSVVLLGLPATATVNFNRVAVNTGITKLVSGRRGITLVSFNEHAHLEQAGQSITYL